MYVTARESFGLLTVRKVGECKPDMSALLAELGNYSYHSGLDVG